MNDMPLIKQTIRERSLLLREQLPAKIRTAFNATITTRLLQLPEYKQAGTVLGYMNFGSEYASELWVAQTLADGKQLVLPKVNRHTNQLDLYLVDDPENQLDTGLWGIREPVVERCKRLNDINEVEFALLPGVAFSRDGARLGYGGGYYDKLLAQMMHRPTLVCAAFGLQIVAQIPQEETDIKTAWIVTEAETIDCSATGNT
ncbi:MAG: 5-formyltetrahydrofolate cyclo-ligase [Gallionella sp.]|nr:5-formyltetrahydrofolate cyclo-ligase [Gallionella sp.]